MGGLMASPITGADGNVEFLLHAGALGPPATGRRSPAGPADRRRRSTRVAEVDAADAADADRWPIVGLRACTSDRAAGGADLARGTSIAALDRARATRCRLLRRPTPSVHRR